MPSGLNRGASAEAQIGENARFAGLCRRFHVEKGLKRRLQTIVYPYLLCLENRTMGGRRRSEWSLKHKNKLHVDHRAA